MDTQTSRLQINLEFLVLLMRTKRRQESLLLWKQKNYVKFLKQSLIICSKQKSRKEDKWKKIKKEGIKRKREILQ